MKGHGSKFARKKEAAIAALLAEKNQAEAARFRLGASGCCVLKLMTDVNVPASVRLRAAECVLDRAIKAVELEDMEDRISELERAAEDSKKRN